MTVKITIKEEFMEGMTTEQREQVEEWLSQCSTQVQEESDKMWHDLMMYGTCATMDGKVISLSDIYKQPPIELNQEHVQMWQSCHDDNPPGDPWLINLFANEHYYLRDKDKHVFYCESCGMTAEHTVTEVQGLPVYECEECGWHEDKVLTDLLMGEGDDE